MKRPQVTEAMAVHLREAAKAYEMAEGFKRQGHRKQASFWWRIYQLKMEDVEQVRRSGE